MASHDQVAHSWAHQTGRNRKGFAMFYDGDTIYSWGYHFPIARHITAPNGEQVVLFTDASYSVSTAKHKTIVRRALGYNRPGVVPVPDLRHGDDKRAAELWWMAKEALIEELALKWKRARTYKDIHAGSMAATIEQANRISELYQLDKPALTMPEDIGAWVSAAEERRKEEQRQKDLKEREVIRKWVNGEDVRPPHTRIPYVRVKGDFVETSWGVKVGLKQARRLYRLAAACARCGHEFRNTKGHRIDGWQINRISGDGTLHVGCHVIPLKVQHEAARLAGLALA